MDSRLDDLARRLARCLLLCTAAGLTLAAWPASATALDRKLRAPGGAADRGAPNLASLSAASGGVTIRVSVTSSGAQANGDSEIPAMSGDGQVIAFVSDASNLSSIDDPGRDDIFAHDRTTGNTVYVSVGRTPGGAATASNDNSFGPHISADGRSVAFYSYASNLVAVDEGGWRDVFVRDLATNQTTLVSVSYTGVQGNKHSESPSISADGRYVAFRSNATNLVPKDKNDTQDIFVRDRHLGDTVRVSVRTGGQQASGGNCNQAAISGDGQRVAFNSSFTNLVPGDTSGNYHVYVHDRPVTETIRLSVTSGGLPASGNSESPSVSLDGRWVAFQSSAPDIVPGDHNGTTDVFVYDLETGAIRRVSVSSAGAEGNGGSTRAAISADGRFVAFESDADNLVPGDGNGYKDVFVHDMWTGETVLISVSSDGAQGHGDSRRPSISSDGCTIAFDSVAENLVVGDNNGKIDIFVREWPCPWVRTYLPVLSAGGAGDWG